MPETHDTPDDLLYLRFERTAAELRGRVRKFRENRGRPSSYDAAAAAHDEDVAAQMEAAIRIIGKLAANQAR